MAVRSHAPADVTSGVLSQAELDNERLYHFVLVNDQKDVTLQDLISLAGWKMAYGVERMQAIGLSADVAAKLSQKEPDAVRQYEKRRTLLNGREPVVYRQIEGQENYKIVPLHRALLQ